MSMPRHCTILQARMPLRMRCPRQIRVCESCMSLRSVPSRTASRWFDSASCRAAADTLLFPCIFIVALGSYARKLFKNSSLLHIHPLRPAIGEETCRATRQYRGLLVFQARPCSNAPYMPSLNKLCFSQRNFTSMLPMPCCSHEGPTECGHAGFPRDVAALLEKDGANMVASSMPAMRPQPAARSLRSYRRPQGIAAG